jgi:sulfate/thiosulfate transport system ATP-binding protein
MKIVINNLNKFYGTFKALDNINLDINKGELVALLGPSGCGKTTLLRIIAGLDYPDKGEIKIIAEENIFNGNKNNIGFVFQHYALFKHMDVFENIAFGLKVKPKNERLSKDNINEKVKELLDLVQMDWAAKRFPNQLSGGQRQRVALARCLAIEPDILLLDEPFGALDAKVRKELRRWLKHLHEKLHLTSIFVTHDQEEALELADRIVVMNQGRIIQEGSPLDVYENPNDPFVFNFLGNVNLFEYENNGNGIQIMPKSIKNFHETENLKVLYVRPHDISLSRERISNEQIKATIKNIFYLGTSIKMELEMDNYVDLIEVEISRDEYFHNNYLKNEVVFGNLNSVKVFDKKSI